MLQLLAVLFTAVAKLFSQMARFQSSDGIGSPLGLFRVIE